ncbi:MAG: hypothetical protein MMC33_001110 [Icmadophila ericetorum]|nr:hypothetical protein [Icmadophila ericetorum]
MSNPRRFGSFGKESTPAELSYLKLPTADVRKSLALENINGVNDFIDKLEKIDLPDQMISILIDPLMQKYVMLRGIEIARTRVDQWLSLVFDSELQSLREGKPMTAKAVEILSKIPDFTRGTKNLPKSVESFLMLYLSFWDGKENRELILENISFLPMGFSLDLQSKGLNKLDIAMVDGTAESGTALLGCYTQLFRHSIARILTIPPNTYPASDLALLVEHISLLSLSLLVSYPASQTTLSAVLSYHEALAFAVSHAATHSHIRIITPLSHNIYLLTFYQSNISNLSRLCSVLATYKRTFESTLTNPPPLPIHEYPREYVNHFNGFLMDVCNLLWRSRAFNTSDTNALGCLLPQAALPHLQTYVRNLSPPQSLPTLFSLSFNPDFSAISIAAFRELEDKAVEGFTEPGIDTRHAGPVTQRSLSALAAEGGLTIGWVDYRLEVLKWLGERGVSGVGELMFCTMKHLMSQGKSQTPSKSRG